MNEQKTLEERKALLAQRVAAAVGLGARIESQSETMAVLVTGKPVNHILTCEGFVQNTTASAMSNVMVVITWVDSNGVPQRTDEALIDYNPVLAGQQSPWSMIGNHNPALNRYRVSFKELLGGTIRHIDES